MSLNQARCVGRHDLFDSTALADHLEARAICAECPALRDCAILANTSTTEWMTAAGGGPVGTWAGKLYGKRGGQIRSATDCGTDAGYYRHRYLKTDACQACKAAHAEAQRGLSRKRRTA